MARKKIDNNQIEMVVVESSEEKGAAELVIAPRVPATAVKTKDPVSSFIVQNILDSGEQLLELEKKGRIKEQIRTKVTFSYEGVEVFAKKGFDLFDQEVHDAVVSLYLAGNQFITLAMVYRAMVGKTNSEYIQDAKLKEIEESIDKCMYSKLNIDASEEAVAYGYEQAIYSGALLAAEKVSIRTGGHQVTAYRLLTEPLLYRYAKTCKQITTLDIKLLDTPVVKTNDTIILQGFLLRKIEAMKSNRYYERTIQYNDIYKALNLSIENRVRLVRVRDYVKQILDFWVEKQYINRYEITMKGRAFKEITIYFFK